ncbi:MAG: hypothetical protein ACREVR_01020 [Burkholderiales bacterium]
MSFSAPPGELLTRFITDKKQIRLADGTIKHTAFMPPKDGRLSVYWVTALPDVEVWRLGDAYVVPHRGPMIGRGDLDSLKVYEQNLRVEIVPVPHERHAEILGWNLASTEYRLQAVKLAAAASLRRLLA